MNEIDFSLNDIKTGMPGAILASLYRSILLNIGMDQYMFFRLILKYIVDTSPEKKSDNKYIFSCKTQLYERLLGDELTWESFLTGMSILNARSIHLVISGTINNKEFKIESPEYKVSTKKDISSNKHVLYGLLMDILKELNIPEDIFIESIKEKYKRVNSKANITGNIIKTFKSKLISWVYFFKLLVILDFKNIISIGVIIKHCNGKNTYHCKNISF